MYAAIHKRSKSDRQCGNALLIALLVTALAAMLAFEALEQTHHFTRQTSQHLRLQQARQLVLGLEDWAISLLMEATAQNATNRDFGTQSALPESMDLPPTPIPGGTIQGRLTDLGGRLNINNLVKAGGDINPVELRRFERLLQLLQLDQLVADQVLDWIDPDSSIQPRGAEDSRYQALQPPRLPANHYFAHNTELLLLPAVDSKVLALLSEFVFVAPTGSTRINLNAAPALVLMVIFDGLDETQAKLIRQNRANDYALVADFISNNKLENYPVEQAGLGVKSEFFLAEALLVSDNIPLNFESLLQRSGNQYYVRSRHQGAD